MPLKAFLDRNVIPLLTPEPKLELYSLLPEKPASGSKLPGKVILWVKPKDPPGWAPASKRLLDAGFRFDYLREPQLVPVDGQVIQIFGGDGTPFVGQAGMAMMRLWKKFDETQVILEVGAKFPSTIECLAAIKSFFGLYDSEGIRDVAAVLERHRPPFGG